MYDKLFECQSRVENSIVLLKRIKDLLNILHEDFFCELLTNNKLAPYEKCFGSLLDSITLFACDSEEDLNKVVCNIGEIIKQIRDKSEEKAGE